MTNGNTPRVRRPTTPASAAWMTPPWVTTTTSAPGCTEKRSTSAAFTRRSKGAAPSPPGTMSQSGSAAKAPRCRERRSVLGSALDRHRPGFILASHPICLGAGSWFGHTAETVPDWRSPLQAKGSLGETNLRSLLEAAQAERATGTLTLRHNGEQPTTLYFLFGHLFHAVGETAAGDDAVVKA